MLAAVAVGIHPNIETAARIMSGSSATFTPDPARIKVYQDLYEAYRMIYPALRDLFPQISKAVAVKQW
jgi:xylulokinase